MPRLSAISPTERELTINNICVGCLIDLKARGGQIVEEDNVKRAVAELED